MIRPIQEQELETCLEIIHKSFQTVADDFGWTPENCPRQTAFLNLERLKRDWEQKKPMFLCLTQGLPVGYFSLSPDGKGSCELNHLAVFPAYRHEGKGREMVLFAREFAERTLHCTKMTIGIVEENTRLKQWYLGLGFHATGTQKFEFFPFTVGYMEMNWQAENELD